MSDATTTGTPAGWYPDPSAQGMQRYWDGSAWTVHVAPLTPVPAAQPYVAQPSAYAAAQPAPSRTGTKVAATVLIVIASIVGVLVIIGILAAIAIPVFLNQRNAAADADAETAVRSIAIEIEYGLVDDPSAALPGIYQELDGSIAMLRDSGEIVTVEVPDGVTFGGLVDDGSSNYCIFVVSSSGSGIQYSPSGGVVEGTCGQGDALSY